MRRALATILVGGCLALTGLTAAAEDVKTEVEAITYLLPAPATLPPFAPWMLAKHAGFYEDEGLQVEFVTAKGGVDVAKQVGAGNADIGGAVGETPILVRANGVPIKAVALLGAGGLGLVVSPASDPVKEPADLKGRTVSVISYTDGGYYALLGTLKRAGLTANDVEIQPAGPAGIWQFLANGKSNVMSGPPDGIVHVEKTGKDLYVMEPSLGYLNMAQSIVASDDAIENRPEMIQKLVRATLRGMELIMKDPDEAVRIYVDAVPAHKGNEEEIRKIFDLLNKYVYAEQEVLGQIDVQRLAEAQDFYVSQEIVRRATPVEELYTNRFIGK